jgi:hypothetical protein
MLPAARQQKSSDVGGLGAGTGKVGRGTCPHILRLPGSLSLRFGKLAVRPLQLVTRTHDGGDS